MKSDPAEEIVATLSDDMQDLLIREAYIRQKRDAAQAELPNKRKQLEGFQQNRPSFLIFRKGAKENFKSAEAKLREEIAALEQTSADCEVILRKTAKIIEAGLAGYFEQQSESFRNAIAAQKLIPEWESSAGLYRAALKRLIMALGIARNQMASGYDRKGGTLSSGAQEAFTSALAAGKAIEMEGTITNRLAKKYREMHGLDPNPIPGEPLPIVPLPYMPELDSVKRVTAIKAAGFEAARAGVVSLLGECEKADEELPNLLEEANRVRGSHESMYQGHIAGPLAKIRLMADEAIEPQRAQEVWVAMKSRFVTLTG